MLKTLTIIYIIILFKNQWNKIKVIASIPLILTIDLVQDENLYME
jgi:hypothetical protein